MRRLIAAILALAALTGAAAPRVITWTQPTAYDDGSALPVIDITGANVFLLGTGATPIAAGNPGTRWYSVAGNTATAVIDITAPTWVSVSVIAGTESARSAPVLIDPKPRAPAAPASVGPVNPRPIVCSVQTGCPGP